MLEGNIHSYAKIAIPALSIQSIEIVPPLHDDGGQVQKEALHEAAV
jgi:hypothetical protein